MPFQPYDGGGQDPLRTLFALQQLKQSMAEQEARKREQALAVGMKLIEAGGSLQGVDPQVQQLLAPVHQAVQQERQRTGLNTALQYAQPVVQAATPYYDESGKLVQPTDPNASLDALRQLGGGLGLNPQAQAILETLANQSVLGGTAAQKAQRAGEVRQDREARGRAAQSAALEAAENRRQESFQRSEAQRREAVAQNEDLVDSLSSRVAAVSSGIANSQEATAVAEELARLNNPSISRRVTSLASKKRFDFLNQVITNDPNTANIDAAADVLGVPTRDVRASQLGFATFDPATNKIARGKFGNTWAEKRVSLVQASGELQGVEDAFYRAQQEAQTDPLAGGPIVGADAFQRFLQATGQQNSAAAEYQSRMASYLLSVSNALVPGVPSNMDMRFVLVQLPTLEELFSGSAEGRFRALNDIQRIAIEAPHNTALGAQVDARKTDSRGLPEANRLVQQFLESGDMTSFNQGLREYKAKYGQRFSVPGVGGGADGSEEGDNLTDQFFNSQLGGP